MDQLELLKNRLNWMFDYRKGNTEYPHPADWCWPEYQKAFYDMTGTWWDSRNGLKYDVYSELADDFYGRVKSINDD